LKKLLDYLLLDVAALDTFVFHPLQVIPQEALDCEKAGESFEEKVAFLNFHP